MARILLVDSDRNCRPVCAAVLTHFGHEVQGHDFLADAAAHAEEGFDLLIVDPGWNYSGQETFLELARRLVPALPIILISGGVTASTATVELRPDVRLLAKPFRIETLRDAVEQLVADSPPAAAH